MQFQYDKLNPKFAFYSSIIIETIHVQKNNSYLP